MSNSGKTYRVVQWATGNIGTRSLRAIIEHPRMELVGLHTLSESKVGRDAGEAAGLAPNGVKTTNDIEAIVALKPDCVVYMQHGVDLDSICRLLESGINVVATRSEFHNPKMMESAMRDRLEDACRRGGSSLHSTGISPGFITEAIPVVLTSIQRRLDFLSIDEYSVMSGRNSPELLFDQMGYGKPPESFNEGMVDHIREAFGPSLAVIADALGLSFDSMEAKGEVALAKERTQVAAGVIEKGTIAAQRMTVFGIKDGKPLMRFSANWFLIPDVDPQWEVGEEGWHIQVKGDTPLDVKIVLPLPPEIKAATTPGYTAHRAVNAIPYVVAAEPGIRTSIEMPQLIAELG